MSEQEKNNKENEKIEQNQSPIKKNPNEDNGENVAVKSEPKPQNPKTISEENKPKIEEKKEEKPKQDKPKEKKEEKKEKPKKVKLWDEIFKDVVTMGLKVGGGVLMFCVLMGAFTALAGLLFVIGFVCLVCTDPFFEVYEEKFKPTLEKTFKSAKEYVKNSWAYHKQKKLMKACKKEQALASANDKNKENNNLHATENKEQKPQPVVMENKPQVLPPKEQPKNNNVPQIAQDDKKVEQKKDVQTKLFKKSELNPLFVKKSELEDNSQTL